MTEPSTTPLAESQSAAENRLQHEIARGLSLCAPGPEYFRALVSTLATTLEVEVVLAAESASDEAPHARPVALYIDGGVLHGEVLDGAEPELDAAPFHEASGDRFRWHGEGLRGAHEDHHFFSRHGIDSCASVALAGANDRFLGWVAVMSRRPMPDRERVRGALDLIARRTTAELHAEIERRSLRRDYEQLENHFARHSVELQRANSSLQREIGERVRVEEQLAFDAVHDPLTRLPNRTLFMSRVEQAIAVNFRERVYDFAVIFLDLDRFKVVNDSLGHAAGDELLRAVAARLVGSVRPSDLVARLGGDEFTVLLENIAGGSDAARVAERISEELARPFTIRTREVFTSASIGIAISTSHYTSVGDIVRDADTAMYRAKEQGGGQYAIFDLQMHLQAVQRLQIEMDLRRAIERREFRLMYQPIVSLQSGDLLGFEALIRWDHPVRGVIMPADFIPIAEETGQIVPIGLWVLYEVCSHMKQWSADGLQPLTMSINLSARQVLDPSLLGHVERALALFGIEGGAIRFEITESAIAEERARPVLVSMRQLGVELCIDDFGTGYSSLSCLVNLPLNVLKIDRAFVSALDCGTEHEEMVRTIVALARNLGLTVIAEGVETIQQVRRLEALGVEYGQGYLFAHPLDAEATKGYVANGRVCDR
ncbi:MAG TPA: EAL domain-containing protein [Thermoanaerobaculia bacterium]|nr:EAL domain-containing protein [Thermoanaerobaculia bacterium]